MNKFNPIKQDKDKNVQRIVWTTKSILAAIDGINVGKKLISNPFYENEIKLLKSDLLYQRTPDEVEHFKQCVNDILIFTKECQLMTPEGVQKVKLRDYQEEYLKHLEDNRLSIFCSCRQSGKTTTSALFMLQYACTNTDKNCLVLGNKLKTAKEILDKIKSIFLYLPYHLKPGVKKWNETEIVFDNGCRIMAEATTINSGISFTYHCVLSDEFAHIQPNIINKFYSNIFPTITAGRARFIISSTQNGYNLFYKLYKSAESGDSEYAPFKVDWYQVPEWNADLKIWEKRDEKWKQQQIANLGGEEEFQMQFGTDFEITGNTLISGNKLKKIQNQSINFKELDMYNGDFWKFHPDIEDINEFKNKFLILTVDIAEGGGGDSSVIAVHELKWDDRLEKEYCELVAVMESNIITVEQLSEKIVQFISLYCDAISGKIILSFERNTYGALLFKSINDVVISNVTYSHNWDLNIHVMYDNRVGWKVTAQSKKDACKLYKYLVENNKIRNIYCKHTSQLECFVDNNNNECYSASFGHDDLVMASVQLSQVTQTQKYKVLCNEFLSSKENNGVTSFFNIYDDPELYLNIHNKSIYDF